MTNDMSASKTPLWLVLLAIVAATAAFTQTTGPPPANPTAPPSAPAARSEADLEKLVAPIALYPDPLLATLLPASAYPLEIVQAARFVKDTNNIAKLDSQPWDENVKALARFPDVVHHQPARQGLPEGPRAKHRLARGENGYLRSRPELDSLARLNASVR